MLGLTKKRNEKVGITYFGLQAHEVAVLKSTMERAPDLASDFELRDPNDAGACEIVVVNKDSKAATSWWNNLKQRNPLAMPLFLTDSKQAANDSTYCKRPFSPSLVQTVFQDLARKGASNDA